MATDEPFSPLKARQFADKYANSESEKQLAQSFWRDFFGSVCGVADLMATGIEFEFPVKSHSTGQTNFVDVLWAGVVLVEHKSKGKDLDGAEAQARDYLVSLPQAKRTPAIIVSDFARIRIVNVLTNEKHEFPLADLPDNLARVEAVVGKHIQDATRPEVLADSEAVRRMRDLYLELAKARYTDHEVSVLLIRLLFLNFGDDTGMWKRVGRGLFAEFVASSPESGQGLGGLLDELFQTLNTPEDERDLNLADNLKDFPYVNGGLFSERLRNFAFTPEIRQALIATTEYDWAKITPAIFGAMFQTVKSKEARRELGEHYTTEATILKVIRPLFLDDYLDRLQKAWNSPSALKALRQDLGRGNYLDPASGSGNFLIVAYQRLRDIELKIIVRLQELGQLERQVGLEGLGNYGLQVHLGQFHAIEIDEWSSQIAFVAMFLADHQANRQLEEITGASANRFPLTQSADIRHANALRLDWSEVVPMDENTVILGNPPFGGAHLHTAEQASDQQLVWGGIKGSGSLDFVANWFLLASRHIASTGGRAGFVATNSITQGEQPPTIWGQLAPLGIGIDFAHRTFVWTNDASAKASVHTVVIGFSARPKPKTRPLWTYKTPKSDPDLTMASNINAYLLNAPSVLITSRSRPLLSSTQPLNYGSKPTDGGFLSDISPEQADNIRATDPIASKYLHRLIGATELINGKHRYCLWLQDADPSDIRTSPVLAERVRGVREMREASKKPATRLLATRPTEWEYTSQPTTDFIAVPLHTSEDRDYVPMAILSPEVIVNNAVSVIAGGSLLTFGWLQSRPFSVWNKAVSGRIKNDTRISGAITYNNFPFPPLTEKQEADIVEASAGVLEAREDYPTASLADLYDAEAMPPLLRSAHLKLDRATILALRLKGDASDDQILARLFADYDELTRGLLDAIPAVRKPRKTTK